MRILTAILALGLGAFLFNRDATRLVLVPIERMMQKVCCSPATNAKRNVLHQAVRLAY